ncbi:OmpA family protein [Myceligenerans salitolerans]|uniref:OmpA family protein n=1 Tax=Myceligenerans salitolerans TaxID=1230528 RepID=A0ABS3I4X0_9MICO|nr:OmpA family protein [Myceligenerans salitolerans]MBO0608061.1 OmpA family protein [Myceligenerans salitolerans]
MSSLKPLLAPVTVAVLVLAGLSGWQDTVFREQIEEKLTASSREALSGVGLDAAEVAFTGRDAIVEADTAGAAATAGAVVRDVTGVRAVQAMGPEGEVEPSSAAQTTPADDGVDDDGAGGGTEDDEATDDVASDGADQEEEADVADDTEGSDDSGSDSDDAQDTDSDADATDADTDSSDSDREPTKKERDRAQEDLVEIPNITFVTNSARLTKDGRKVVRQAADVLEEHPDIRVRIEGHTDSRGDEDDNLRLSERRALTVLDRLVDLGVDEDRLAHKGFGESDPLIAPRTFADLEKNRRVEFVVLD